jgi:hypothetical protein
MRNMIGTKVIAGGCLLLGLFAGVAGTQVVGAALSTTLLHTGLFWVSAGGEANFYVSRDDSAGGPPAKVFLQAFDENGTPVARREAVLGVGQSTALRVPGPGHFRVRAAIEPWSLPLTDLPAVVRKERAECVIGRHHPCTSSSRRWVT